MNSYKKKNVLLSFALLLLIFVFNGCKDEETTTVVQEINFMIPAEGSSLDPNFSNETYSTIVLNHIYEGLVYFDEESNLVLGAAESYEASDQNTTFTFKLRDNLKWSDGKKVTAKDYRDSWMRIIHPDAVLETASIMSPYVLNVTEYMNGEASEDEVGIYVLDELTLQIKTKAPTPFLVDVLSHNIFFPVRLDIVEEGGANWHKNAEIAISNGPFYLSEYVPGEYIEISKNQYYWDNENIKLDKIRFSFRKDDTDIVSLYSNKKIDGLFEITATELRNIPESELDTFTKILPSTAFITLNHDNDLMNNGDFREVLSISIDRAGIVNDVLLGAGIPTKYLVPINYQIGGEPFRDYTELDDGAQIDKAKEIIQKLKDEGIYDGRAIKFHYMENGPDAKAAEYIIRKYEEDLGIEVEAIGMTWPDLYDIALNGDYDVLMMGWGADYPHPMTFLSIFEEGSFYFPITRWKDLEYEKKLGEFLLITDEKESLDALREIEDMILDDHHIIPLYYRKGVALISRNVKGWYRSSAQFHFSRAWIEE